MKKLIYGSLFVAALGACGYYAWRELGAKPEAAAPALATAKVERGAIALKVATTGRVVANLDVDIKCKASGEIMQLPFDVSDAVPKGSLLVEVDPVYAKRAVNQADVAMAASQARLNKAREGLRVDELALETERLRAAAAVKSAEAQLQYARLRAARMKDLAQQHFGSQEEADLADSSAVQAEAVLDNAHTRLEELKTLHQALELKRQDVKLGEAEVQSDQIRLDDARQALADTKVTAPLDGVVSARNVQQGQIIASGISNVGGGTTVLTLSDLSRLFVLASVDESDIGKVAAGQPAVIRADAFPGKQFRGKVVRIATRGVNVSNVVTFEVKIEVLGEKKATLKPEMTANVEIVAAQKDETLLVPVEAVSRQKGKQVAQVLKEDGSQEERTVEGGIADSVHQEILSGLQEGETVVLKKGPAESKWRNEKKDASPFAGRIMLGGGKK